MDRKHKFIRDYTRNVMQTVEYSKRSTGVMLQGVKAIETNNGKENYAILEGFAVFETGVVYTVVNLKRDMSVKRFKKDTVRLVREMAAIKQ